MTIWRQTLSLVLALSYVVSVLSTPLFSKRESSQCEEVLERKAWHTLSDLEKKSYIDAELCLMWQRPSQTHLGAAVSRFDDLIKMHQLQYRRVHGTGWFLPFHRLMMWVHEQTLRTECGYTGAQPYWDESLDAGAFQSAQIFSPTTGFGGDGSASPPHCITSGPFANYTLHTGPGEADTEHCITRRIDNGASQNSANDKIEFCTGWDTFNKAWRCFEGAPHGGGHGGVGGEMLDPVSSPGDPLFYLHHTFLDRLWWKWQEQNLTFRLNEIDGYTTIDEPESGWVNATLDDDLNLWGIMPNRTIRETMDIGASPMCYAYI